MIMLHKNVLIRPDEKVEKVEGGISIPASADSLTYGRVVEVGPEVTEVTCGDNVLLPKGELMKVDYKGAKYIVIPVEGIVAIV